MEEVKKRVERLFLMASVLLVVLTVLFSQFMNAQKFWQGKAIDIEIRLLDPNIDNNTKRTLDEKRKWFDGIHKKQNNFGRVFAGLMGFVFVVSALNAKTIVVTIGRPLSTKPIITCLRNAWIPPRPIEINFKHLWNATKTPIIRNDMQFSSFALMETVHF